MPDETLADLLNSVGLRPAWERTREARPGYQQQQSPAGALADPRTLPYRRIPTRRDREFSRASLADTAQRGAWSEPRNQIAEAGMNVLETTGAPSFARGVRSLQANEPGRAAGEFAMGGLGLLGTASLPFGGGARAAPPRIPRIQQAMPEAHGIPDAPPRLPGRATDGSVLPMRPREPIRQSLVGGSDDLREAAQLSGARSELDRAIEDLRRTNRNRTPANIDDETISLGNVPDLPPEIVTRRAPNVGGLYAREMDAAQQSAQPARFDHNLSELALEGEEALVAGARAYAERNGSDLLRVRASRVTTGEQAQQFFADVRRQAFPDAREVRQWPSTFRPGDTSLPGESFYVPPRVPSTAPDGGPVQGETVIPAVHSTRADFETFDPEQIGKRNGDPGWRGRGFYFYRDSPEFRQRFSTNEYAAGAERGFGYGDVWEPVDPANWLTGPQRAAEGSRTMLVDLHLRKVLSDADMDNPAIARAFADAGYEGIERHARTGAPMRVRHPGIVRGREFEAADAEAFARAAERLGYDGGELGGEVVVFPHAADRIRPRFSNRNGPNAGPPRPPMFPGGRNR